MPALGPGARQPDAGEESAKPALTPDAGSERVQTLRHRAPTRLDLEEIVTAVATNTMRAVSVASSVYSTTSSSFSRSGSVMTVPAGTSKSFQASRLSLRGWHRANLLQEAEHVGLPGFFDDLSVGESVDV